MKKWILIGMLFATVGFAADVLIKVDVQDTSGSKINVYEQDRGTMEIKFFRDGVATQVWGLVELWYGTNALASGTIVSVATTNAYGVDTILMHYPDTNSFGAPTGRRPHLYGVSVSNKVFADGDLFIKDNPSLNPLISSFGERLFIDWGVVTAHYNSASAPFLMQAGDFMTGNLDMNRQYNITNVNDLVLDDVTGADGIIRMDVAGMEIGPLASVDDRMTIDMSDGDLHLRGKLFMHGNDIEGGGGSGHFGNTSVTFGDVVGASTNKIGLSMDASTNLQWSAVLGGVVVTESNAATTVGGTYVDEAGDVMTGALTMGANTDMGRFDVTNVDEVIFHHFTGLVTLDADTGPLLRSAGNTIWTDAVGTTPAAIDQLKLNNGATLTNLVGTEIRSGTVPDARIAAAITRDTEWNTLAKINTASTDTDAVLDTDIGVTVQAFDSDIIINNDGSTMTNLDHGVGFINLTHDDHTQYLELDGSDAMTGTLNVKGSYQFHSTNLVNWFAGTLNGTNGVYYGRIGTNYWLLEE